PFDGGPHFTAPTDEVTLVRASHAARVAGTLPEGEHPKTRALVAVEHAEPPFFRAVAAPWRRDAAGSAVIGAGAARLLGLSENDDVWVCPWSNLERVRFFYEGPR